MRSPQKELPIGGSTDSEVRADYRARRLAYDMSEKAIRDLDREQWARMSEYLSPYELREYNLEHAQLARDMRPETEWFQPSKGEFVALYTYHEKQADLLDEMFGGDRQLLWDAHQSAIDQRMAIQKEVIKTARTRKDLEEGRQRMNALEGKGADYYRAEQDLYLAAKEWMGVDRWSSFLYGPGDGQKTKALVDEVSLAKYKSFLEFEGGMSEEKIGEELKWYREEVMELPPAEYKSVDEDATRGNGFQR